MDVGEEGGVGRRGKGEVDVVKKVDQGGVLGVEVLMELLGGLKA